MMHSRRTSLPPVHCPPMRKKKCCVLEMGSLYIVGVGLSVVGLDVTVGVRVVGLAVVGLAVVGLDVDGLAVDGMDVGV